MKKKIISTLLLFTLAFSLIACGKEEPAPKVEEEIVEETVEDESTEEEENIKTLVSKDFQSETFGETKVIISQNLDNDSLEVTIYSQDISDIDAEFVFISTATHYLETLYKKANIHLAKYSITTLGAEDTFCVMIKDTDGTIISGKNISGEVCLTTPDWITERLNDSDFNSNHEELFTEASEYVKDCILSSADEAGL